MSLRSGDRLGPYEIVAPLGAGGMGEVYRARDPRVGREVAIKVSAEQFSDRFEREARAIAALNHPNICTLYDVGPNYLVMELVDGATLEELIAGLRGAEAPRLRRPADGSGAGLSGPASRGLAIADALSIARQITDALDAAHEKGIVHRDLKPGNVKITPDGVVKVLDFGLAKAVAPATTSSVSLANSPTLTRVPHGDAGTEFGIILGTAAYMSPEQARGREVDKRTDIWAFGVVLYEMLTGRRLFSGEDVSEILATVIKTEPEWTTLPEGTPNGVRVLLRRSLQKDRKQRLRDIGDARVLMDETFSEAPPVPSAPAGVRPRSLGWLVAGLATIAAIALAAVHLRETPPDRPVIRSSVLPPDEASPFVLDSNIGGTAISPDGRLLAFVANVKGTPMLWVRQLDSLSARVLPGTEEAARPFWNPDSRNIGFYSQGKLRRIGLTEGAPRVICDLTLPRGATWNSNGIIVLSLARPGVIARVSASGGTPVEITALNEQEREENHYWPQFLPDGKHFLFVARSRRDEGNRIVVRVASIDDAPGGNGAVLVESAYGAVFVPQPADSRTGHLLFVQGASLMAQAFDSATLKLSGEAVQIAQDIGGTESTAYVDLSASSTGVLAYGNSTQGQRRQHMAWVAPSGKVEPIAESTASPRLSPDGHTLVVTRPLRTGRGIDNGPGARADVVLIDLARSNNERVLTFSGANRSPMWSPDGSEIVYSTAGKGLSRKSLSGAGEALSLSPAEPDAGPLDWSSDGKFLLYGTTTPDQRQLDLRAIPMEPGSAGKPFTYLAGLASPINARFSPNRTGERWVAYSVQESGRRSVFVQDFPGARRKEKVAADGESPVWSRDGHTLFFRRGTALMSVAVRMTAGEIAFDAPKQVVAIPGLAPTGIIGAYDVGPDGRFVLTVVEELSGPLVKPITLVQNWQTALTR